MTSRDTRRVVSSLLLVIVIPVVTSFLLPHILPSGYTTNGDELHLWGSVVDATTEQPIENASILLFERRARVDRPTSWAPFQLATVVQTMNNGSYHIYPTRDPTYLYRYRLYAFQNHSQTPGFDYLPVMHDVTEHEAPINFQLMPAASLILDGPILLIDAWNPTGLYTFTVCPSTAVPLGSILTYGTPESWSNHSDRHSTLLGLGANHVLIPAQTTVSIEVHVPVTDRVPVITDPGFYVAPGTLLHVDLVAQLLPYNHNLTVTTIDATEAHITVMEQQGLYTAVARHDIRTAWTLVDESDGHREAGAYYDAYGDLREAYLLTTRLDATLNSMYADAANSVYIIIMFLAGAAITCASCVSDHRRRQVVIASLVYLLMLASFYIVYVGCHLVDTVSFTGITLASFVFALVIPTISTRCSPQTLGATFVLAKRNLLRRKTRFFLTVNTIILLVMAFVSLTSFTSEYGFVTSTQSVAVFPITGTLLQHPAPDVPTVWYGDVLRDLEVVSTFTPMTAYDVQWLQYWTNITAVAPKVENVAFRNPFALLDHGDPMTALKIRGVLGVSPHEGLFTSLSDAVIDGRYLRDNETHAILLSAHAARSINAHVGDVWTLRVGSTSVNVTVIGLFDDAVVRDLIDLNGASLLPQKLTVISEADVDVEGRIESCDPAEIVILDWQTALQTSAFLQISRINLDTRATDPVAFARQLAVTRDFWAYTIVDETLHFSGSVTSYEVRGLAITVPWLIVILNVVLIMMNAIYERRHEIAVLSSVGLNPTHITAVFTFEAVIMGFIGGAIGYLLGQGSYHLAALASIEVLVEQKVSAVWTLISLSIAIMAVVIGAMIALKASTVITPSLLRRWGVKGFRQFGTSSVPLTIPVRVNAEEVEELFTYIIRSFNQQLQARGIDIAAGSTRIHQTHDRTRLIKTLSITYLLGDQMKLGAFPFNLIARQVAKEEAFRFEVVCNGPNTVVEETVRFLRWTIIEWSERKRTS